MEVEVIAPWKTTFLYQEGVVNFHVSCRESECLSMVHGPPIWQRALVRERDFDPSTHVLQIRVAPTYG